MRFFAAFLWISLGSPAAFAQSGGAITGTVYDVDGIAVPNAPIQVTNKTTNAIVKVTSAQTGGYTIAPLPAGSYDLSIAAPGFNAYTKQNLSIGAGQTVHLEIRLEDFQLGTLGDGREFRADLLSAHPTPSGPAPRTPDGKPDLSGVWYA